MALLLRLFFFLALSINTSQAEEAKMVNITKTSLQNGILTLQHSSMGDIKFKKRIYDSPPRLIFDILDSRLAPNQALSHANISDEILEAKVQQFDPSTVRITCKAKSLSSLEKVKIDNLGQNLVFRMIVGNIKIQDIAILEGDLRISSDGSINPRTILLDNPTRLVVDLIGAELKSNLQEKNQNLANEQIRISQFDKSTVRIVITSPKAHGKEVRISDNDKILWILGDNSKQKQIKKDDYAELNSIKILKADAKETSYTIDSNQKIIYKVLRLHDPERLVIDFVDTKFADSFGLNLTSETTHVSALRFGLASQTRPVTRLVIDLKSKNYIQEIKESTTNSNQIIIRILGQGQGISSTEEENIHLEKNSKNKVVIDAGHGGYDHGAMYGGHNEKDINLAVASKVEALLKQAGIATFMTRTEDRFISLAERVEIANNIDPDIFVSLHSNAVVTNPKMQGLQTYYYSGSSLKLAQSTHAQLIDDVKMPDGRIRKAGFWVCKYSKSPSILIEMGFMTNSEERDKLVNDHYQNDLAKAISKGIIKYLEENT